MVIGNFTDNHALSSHNIQQEVDIVYSVRTTAHIWFVLG